jgi:hypothetical protein
MSHEGDEACSVHREHTRTARRPHWCSACGDPISPGHRYVYLFVVWDGDTYQTRRCLRCQAIHVHLRERCRDERPECYPADALDCGEDYRENWGEDPPVEIAALAFVTGAEMQPKRPS